MTPYPARSDKYTTLIFHDTTNIIAETRDVGSGQCVVFLYVEGNMHYLLDIGIGHCSGFCAAPTGLKLKGFSFYCPWVHAHG